MPSISRLLAAAASSALLLGAPAAAAVVVRTTPAALPADASPASDVQALGADARKVRLLRQRSDLPDVKELKKDEAKKEAAAMKEGAAPKAEGGEHKVPSAARAYAVGLLGSVVLVMCVFYLVNWPDADVRLSTWQVLSMTASIFSAVLIYSTASEFMKEQLHVHRLGGNVAVDASMFVVAYIALQVTLFAMMKGHAERSKLASFGGVMAHITGFAAMYTGAGLLHVERAEDNPGFTWLVVFVLGLVLYALTLIGAKLRNTTALADDGVVSEDEQAWMEAVDDVEDDVTCLAIGFCIMQAFRRSIIGKPNPYLAADPPLLVQQVHANWLLVCAVGAALLTVLFARIRHSMKQAGTYNNDGINSLRFVGVIRNTWSTCFAWCLIFWIEWQVYVVDQRDSLRIIDLLVQALLAVIMCVALTLVLDKIADFAGQGAMGMRRLIFSIGLLAGFSWERTFDLAIDQYSTHHGGPDTIWRHLVRLALAAAVLPAWSWYILPKAQPLEED
eukprot:CAMPEP_0176026936 /NCGR_PEP_ID=MMETSP0120_2-20121206/13204_1 /TAXON_ID=160619 /ORGANISM="Kryptoperidinium foliaceum, Strain CCMP 1326" /LENGTH=502 /DNA_ID=CAMNT_0017360141 /DNA_START=35 /DNA_END=1543 /DNA_ORIENTATION=-